MKDSDVSIQLTAITHNNEMSNNQSQMMNRNVHVQIDLTATVIDDENTGIPQRPRNEDVGVQTELTPIILYDENTGDQEIDRHSSQWFSTPHLTTNEEDILDRGQTEIVRENLNAAPSVPMTNNRRIVEISTQRLNSTITNTIDDAKADLLPIAGYADEPLLPLFKACAPLAHIVYNLSFYVQMALNQTPEQPEDGLTIDESAAIRLYTFEWNTAHPSLYEMLNYTLKEADRELLRPYFKFLKLFLTALVKLPCVPPLTIWRGVTRNLSAEFPIGTSVTWWAFSSCTTELPVLENNAYLGNMGDRTLFSVEAINGRAIRTHSQFVQEDEILLLPGTHMVVQSQFSPAADLHIVHLKQVIPEEMLLEPPFEGNLNVLYHFFCNRIIFIPRCMPLPKRRVSLVKASFCSTL